MEQIWIATSYDRQPNERKEPGFLHAGERYIEASGKGTHADEDIIAALGDKWEIIEGASNVNVCAAWHRRYSQAQTEAAVAAVVPRESIAGRKNDRRGL